MTDDQILSALGRMDQEQKFFEQMNAARAFVRDIIRRYKEIQTKLPDLAKEEARLRDSIVEIEANIVAVRREGAIRSKAEHDQLATELRERLEPLKVAFEQALERTKTAEKQASETEAACNASIVTNLSAAEAADAKRIQAEKALANFTKRFVTV